MANSVFLWWGTGQVIVGPITIQGNVLPSADNTYDLGSSSLEWRTLYFGTSVVGPVGTFTTSVTQGSALNLTTTSTDGIVMQNTTAATSGVTVQISPRLRFRSQVWNTTATAANNTNDFFIESVPVSGTTPSGLLKFGSSLNGGAATYPATLTSAGVFSPLSGVLVADGTAAAPSLAFASGANFGLSKSSNTLVMSTAGNAMFAWGNVYGQVRSDGYYAWSATTDPTGGSDLLLKRIAAGQLGLQKDSTHGVTLDVGTDAVAKFFARDGSSAATLQVASIKMTTATAFASGDKYVVVDSSGNFHVSALGPAS